MPTLRASLRSLISLETPDSVDKVRNDIGMAEGGVSNPSDGRGAKGPTRIAA